MNSIYLCREVSRMNGKITVFPVGMNLEDGEIFSLMLRQKLHPGSSDRYGVLVAVPDGKELTDEFESPTPLDSKVDGWKLKTAMPCLSGFRERSMEELLFCMLRSGK